MKFYWLKNSDVEKLSGGKDYAQIEFVTPDRLDPKAFGKLSDDYSLKELNTIFQLTKGSKLTDVLRYSPRYFIFNAKTKAVFEQFEIRDSYFIPVKIIEPSNDSWFVMYTPFSQASVEMVDYSRTVFHVTDPFEEKTFSTFQIDSKAKDKVAVWQEYAKKTDFEQYVRYKDLFLKDECAKMVDLFYLSPFHLPKNLISERLKEALEAANITGFKFIPAKVCN